MWATVGQYVARRTVRTFLRPRPPRRTRRDEDDERGGQGWFRRLLIFAGMAVLLFVGTTTAIIVAVLGGGQSASAMCPVGGGGLQATGPAGGQGGAADQPGVPQPAPGPPAGVPQPAPGPAAGEDYAGPSWQDKVLTAPQLAEVAAGVGFGGEDLPVAVAVALAESSGDVDATNANDNGTTDYGLWQINSVHSAWFDTSKAFEPAYNASAARRVFLNAGSSWSPWVAYNSGAYEQHMAAARQAAGGAPVADVATAGDAACGIGPANGSTWAQALQRRFPANIDPYQPSDPQSTCDVSPKPGVEEFANMLLAAYPQSGMGGIVRDCSVGGPSEHKEGRAFDWMVNVSVPEQRAAAEEVINTLLATDEHGNTHALFRRFGLMYMIWNRQIISSNRIDEGWRPYSCNGSPGDCHTNHIHFSFGWDGANRRTSWWTQGVDVPTAGRPGQAARAD